MNESVLMYAWKFRCFDTTNLYTTDGEKIEILKTGTENTDAGPDFFLAKIRVGDTDWVGNIEIHVHSSEWTKHRHGYNKAYENVILHVVYEHDEEVIIKNRRLPTLQLKGLISETFLSNYQSITRPFRNIPCESLHDKVEDLHKSTFLSGLLFERLSEKCFAIEELYNQYNGDLNETFYQCLLKGFGQKVNKEAFELLSRKLPYRVLRRYLNEPRSVEALLYGVAGFLNGEVDNSWYWHMQEEFNYLKQKHALEQMDVSVWKFLRMRPANFPTIRLSQLAGLLCTHKDLGVFYNHPSDMEWYEEAFHIKASEFWNDHFTFLKTSSFREKYIGKDFVKHLLINVVFPFTFFASQEHGIDLSETIEVLYRLLEKEENRYTRIMSGAGFPNMHAAHSQALIQLNTRYCEPKKCLNCNIGYQVLKL